jgi:glutaredoxin-related protein
MNTVVWSKENCVYCVKAKALLESNDIQYEERQIGELWTKEQLLEDVPTARTVPQIFLDGKYIGGYMELLNTLLPNRK